MNSIHPLKTMLRPAAFARGLLWTGLALALSGCASMSERDRNTAVGAAVGGVAGSILTDGGTLGTLGGAMIGGAIGRGVDADKKGSGSRGRNDDD